MKILFLTSRFPTQNNHFTLEKELVFAFNKNGHTCTVANILEKKQQQKSNIKTLNNGIKVLNIRTGNLFNDVNVLEKKITAFSLPYIFKKEIPKLLPNDSFDLIIAYGPYLCGSELISSLKKTYKAKAILVQWDIFPQNAYDLNIIKNKLIFNYLKYKQKAMLAEYDLILCNSEGNIAYLKQHFPKEVNNKCFLFHNCESASLKIDDRILDGNKEQQTELSNNGIIESPNHKNNIKTQYKIPSEAITLIFGGNIGIPQALTNIISLADKFKHNKKLHFVIIGRGTEANKIKELSTERANVTYIDYIASSEYEKLLSACDYGIISLSEKFTVPNFPAKVTSYLKHQIPIFACLDDAAYNDLGMFITNNEVGYCIKARELKSSFHDKEVKNLEELLSNSQHYQKLKNNAEMVFNQYFNMDEVFSNLYSRINLLFNKSS